LKLLFDQNISYRLVKKIHDAFPLSNHIETLGLTNATDLEIWSFAKENDFTIVSFDGDFLDLNTLYGSPPKIIWIRTGNMTTNNLTNLFFDRKSLIWDFLKDNAIEVLQILVEK
jgi:predicted nuclease of predicted toxin-antitoxin system